MDVESGKDVIARNFSKLQHVPNERYFRRSRLVGSLIESVHTLGRHEPLQAPL
jgi:hypothetical protein